MVYDSYLQSQCVFAVCFIFTVLSRISSITQSVPYCNNKKRNNASGKAVVDLVRHVERNALLQHGHGRVSITTQCGDMHQSTAVV